MKNTDFLASLFRWLRLVVEEADKPLSLLIVVFLPLIAPIIPSIITAGNLQLHMGYTPSTALTAAIAFAVVGYASMITTVGSMMNMADQPKTDRIWLPVLITGGSYLVYVIALIMVNVVLEYNAGVSGTKIFVTALMTLGLEIPAALLNGTRVARRDDDERKTKLWRESKEYNLERLRIKAGFQNTSGTKVEVSKHFQNTSGTKTGRKPIHQERVFEYMEVFYSKTGKVATFTDLARDLSLPQSTASRLRNEWIQSKERVI